MSIYQSRFVFHRSITLLIKILSSWTLCLLILSFCFIKISDIESRISALTNAGLNIAPCGRLTRKRTQKQRNQVSPSLASSAGKPHDLENAEAKTPVAPQRCADACVLFAGTNHRHIEAAEEETACSARERYASIRPQSRPRIKPDSLT